MDTKNISQQSLSEGAVEKAAFANELMQNVCTNISSVLQPKKFISFLNMTERFHWYSFINTLLILSQFPQAQALAGYDVWKRISLSTYNDPNHRILKLSSVGQGIKVIAPFTVVNGSVRSLIHVAVSVYDVNQMNELPAPEFDFPDLSKVSYVDIINAINYVSPYRVVIASPNDNNLSYNVKGYCDHKFQQIVLDGFLSVSGKLVVLLHELAVASVYLLHYKNELLRVLVEESVNYILLMHFGLATQDITFSYIERFSSASDTDLIEAFHTIQSVAHSIIERVEDQLELIIEMTPSYDDLSYQPNFFDDLEFLQGSSAK